MDTTAITERCKQVHAHLNQTRQLCQTGKKLIFTEAMCENLDRLATRTLDQINERTDLINNIYTTKTIKRRGLVDGIGSIAKNLFGTMDANDEKIINEQLALLENNQEVLRHAVTHQIGVLNKTIGHINALETTLSENTNLL